MALITESRHQVAYTGAALVERAAKVAYNYESLLGLLDEADRALGGGTH
jgi:hypothetical protein